MCVCGSNERCMWMRVRARVNVFVLPAVHDLRMHQRWYGNVVQIPLQPHQYQWTMVYSAYAYGQSMCEPKPNDLFIKIQCKSQDQQLWSKDMLNWWQYKTFIVPCRSFPLCCSCNMIHIICSACLMISMYPQEKIDRIDQEIDPRESKSIKNEAISNSIPLASCRSSQPVGSGSPAVAAVP